MIFVFIAFYAIIAASTTMVAAWLSSALSSSERYAWGVKGPSTVRKVFCLVVGVCWPASIPLAFTYLVVVVLMDLIRSER